MSDGANKPRCTARAFPGPVLLEVVLAGLDVAARDKNDNANKAIENGINENTTDQRLAHMRREGRGKLTRSGHKLRCS